MTTLDKYASGKWDVRGRDGNRLPCHIEGGNGKYIVVTKDGQLGAVRTLKAAAELAVAHSEGKRNVTSSNS